MPAIICERVWKKYLKGERIYSLRDFIPHMARSLFEKKQLPSDFLSAQEFWVLKDVTFEVKKGEVLGIIGPNGAGKSTILKLLSRIIRPNKGTFQVNGRLSALIEITAGFHPDFTGRENVYFNGAILGMTKKEIDKKFDEIVEFSGVEEFIDTPVKRYSSGMYARLGFSVAAHVDPDILLVDEVLSVGDMTFQAKCAQKMRDLLKSGVTICMVSHNIPLVQNICSRVVLMDHGQILREGVPEEVIPYYQNLVMKKSEEELKRKIAQPDYRIEVSDEPELKLSSVRISGQAPSDENTFLSHDTLHLDVEYESSVPIEDPLFSFEITRGDGVVCCAGNTKDSGFQIPKISGKGKIRADLGVLRLAPGVYYLDVTVWDREMVHPYAVSRRQIFKIDAQIMNMHLNAAFLPLVTWQRQDG